MIPAVAERVRSSKANPFVTAMYLQVDLDKRVRRSAFHQEIALSTVMVDAIEAWLDARKG